MAYTLASGSIQAGPGPSYFKSNYAIVVSSEGIRLRRWVSIPAGSGWGGTGMYCYWKGGASNRYNMNGAADPFSDTDTYNWLNTGVAYNLGNYNSDSGSNLSTKVTSASGSYSAIPTGSYTFYKVAFDTNGGTITEQGNLEHCGGNHIYTMLGKSSYSNMSTTVVSKTGYRFKGWYNSKVGGNKVYDANGVRVLDTGFWKANADGTGTQWIYKNNVTLYAQWEGLPYTVTFNGNGGTSNILSKSVEYGSAYGALPTPTRNGYKFLGWYTEANGGTLITNSNTYGTLGNTNLYAHWEQITYTVSYDANGGSGAPSNQTKTFGVNLALSSIIPTKYGYAFQGWAMFPGGAVAYKPGALYTANEPLWLYAVWKMDSVIYFHNNGKFETGTVYLHNGEQFEKGVLYTHDNGKWKRSQGK